VTEHTHSGDAGGELVIQPSDIDDIDKLFDLYTQKVRELEILNNSIASTGRLRSVMADIVKSVTGRAANDNVDVVRVEIKQLEKRIVHQLAQRPDDLYRLEPRQFEELVCALLADMGLDVRLTPQVKDGGRDVLAVLKTPLGELLTIVECKRYRPDRPVRINEIRSFLFTVREYDRASCGLLATTSYFSPASSNLAADYAYLLKLRDVKDIRQWLAQYGTWTQSKNTGFWLPGGSSSSQSSGR